MVISHFSANSITAKQSDHSKQDKGASKGSEQDKGNRSNTKEESGKGGKKK